MVTTLVKGNLEWPITKCECGYDLREAEPKATEKANDSSGRLIWNDFCPKCGRGYQVGLRVLPDKPPEDIAILEANKVVPKEVAPVFSEADPEHLVTPGKPQQKEPSGIPPDERNRQEALDNPDPEGILAEPEEAVVEKGTPREGQYWCTKCAKIHNDTSKLGKKHLKYRE